MWRVESPDRGRWVAGDGAVWDADDRTRDTLEACLSCLGCVGGDDGDQAAGRVYVMARFAVPGPHTVTGTPPPVPALPEVYVCSAPRGIPVFTGAMPRPV